MSHATDSASSTHRDPGFLPEYVATSEPPDIVLRKDFVDLSRMNASEPA
ncbi:MAG: hypothetical protein ACLQO6_04870 [Desulfomonilaceae bacterium]